MADDELRMLADEVACMRGRIATIESALADVRRERHLLDHRLESMEGKIQAMVAHQAIQDGMIMKLDGTIRKGTSIAAAVPSGIVLLAEILKILGVL